MNFTTPWALLLLLVVPLIVWIGRPRGTLPIKGRDRAALILRAVILTFLILALAGLQIVRTADELAVVFLVDGSDSIAADQAVAAETLIREALVTMGPNDQAAVVVFGANALVDRPMSRLDQLSSITSVPQTLQTDLAEAIRLGLAIFPAGTARRLVILSDGAATIGDTDAAARLATASGVVIDFVPLLRNATEDEAWLTSVSAPTRLTIGEVFNIDIAAESTVNTPATIRVLYGGQIVSEQAVDLSAGLNNFSVRLQANIQEFARYTVQLVPERDTYFQNNQLAAYTDIAGQPRVLLVSSDGTLDDDGSARPEEANQLTAALEATGLIVERATPLDVPANFAELSNYASVILVNVNAKLLSPRKMEALQQYVRDLGGGLVVVGGPESFGMGGYFKTPLEAALPVNMQINDEERFPAVSIVIVIDRSGSMSAPEGGLTKIQLAAEGAVRVVELLNDFDDITVIPVDTAPSGQIGPIQATQRAEAIKLIRGIGAGGGGIFVRTGLEAAADALAQSPNQVKHIILLADGADAEEQNGVPELIEQLKQDQVTLTSVSIGNGKDFTWLQQMAELGGGRFHFTDRAANLPQIFTQETTQIQRSYLVEEEFFPTLGRRSPILSGIVQVPSLDGYVGTSPKNTAQVVLQTHLDDPLLATWQYGLGRSVAWTSDATGRWATNWVNWEGFPVFWAQTVRWTVSTSRNSAVETVIELQGETAELTVDARTPAGVYLNGLDMEASVISPSGQDTNLALQQIAPGRYRADFAPGEEGAYFIRVAGSSLDQDTVIGQTTGWVLGYSPEYQQFDANPQLLERLAEQTGGRNLDGVAEAVFEHNLPSQATTRPIWPWLLMAAVILLPFDIGVRRLIITRRDRQRAAEVVMGRFRRQEVVAAERTSQMSTLFEAKERARQKQETAGSDFQLNTEDRAETRERKQESGGRKPETRVEKPKAGGGQESGESLAARLLKKKLENQNKDENQD